MKILNLMNLIIKELINFQILQLKKSITIKKVLKMHVINYKFEHYLNSGFKDHVYYNEKLNLN